MESLRKIETWPVPHAAAAVVRGADGALLGAHGPLEHLFPLASVTKLLTSYAVLVAVEEGVFELDDPAGPEGSTVRHLLAHTSGLAFDEHRVMAEPGNHAALLQPSASTCWPGPWRRRRASSSAGTPPRRCSSRSACTPP